MSIEGDECNIESLSKLAELTGGMVDRVSPTTLTSNFASMLANSVIATNVTTKVKIHKGLQFRNENVASLSQDRSLLAKEMGNVTEDTQFTFEYTIKPIKELVAMDDIDLTQIKEFPFQTQIFYTTLDGFKCLRVITKKQIVSDDREKTEQTANFEIIRNNATVQSSKVARGGDFKQAQAIAKTWKRKMVKNAITEEHV